MSIPAATVTTQISDSITQYHVRFILYFTFRYVTLRYVTFRYVSLSFSLPSAACFFFLLTNILPSFLPLSVSWTFLSIQKKNKSKQKRIKLK
jgi:hypothetical protein